MKSRQQRSALILTTLLGISLNTQAQNGINSPYSRYGFGMMADRATGFNKAMGGVAQGFRHGQQINVGNPASYSAVDSLTMLFDLGMSVYNGNYQIGNVQENARNSSFDYFAMQFRVRKGLGVSLGILPYTNIKYSFSSVGMKVTGSDNVTATQSFTGDGGLHQVFIGAGWQPFRNFSIGANVSYLYGDYRHTSTIAFSDNSAFPNQITYSADIATYKLDFGVQYTMPLSAKDDLTFGATYGLGHDINNRAYYRATTLENNTTTAEPYTISNAFQLPHGFNVGLTYRHALKWRIGADFLLEKWSDARFPSQSGGVFKSTTGQLNDHIRFSLGGEYTPDIYGSFLKRVSYRAGAYYSQSYARADLSGKLSDKPLEYGLSAGFSIPITGRHVWYNTPRLNVAFQWVHSDIPFLNSQNGSKSHLKENYLRLSVGLTFSERWFYKWKVQ